MNNVQRRIDCIDDNLYISYIILSSLSLRVIDPILEDTKNVSMYGYNSMINNISLKANDYAMDLFSFKHNRNGIVDVDERKEFIISICEDMIKNIAIDFSLINSKTSKVSKMFKRNIMTALMDIIDIEEYLNEEIDVDKLYNIGV